MSATLARVHLLLRRLALVSEISVRGCLELFPVEKLAGVNSGLFSCLFELRIHVLLRCVVLIVFV